MHEHCICFYGPNIYLPDLVLLRHVQHLHLTNGWVARRGLFIGLHELSQLMHLSFHICSPGQRMTHPEVLFEIFQRFLRLRVVVLWWMEYHASEEIYSNLVQQNLMDHCIVVFNSAHFTEYTGSISSFWEIAERVVQWQENNQSVSILFFVLGIWSLDPLLLPIECCDVPSNISSFDLLA